MEEAHCGRVLPRRLLVAAHIKLRAKASEAERMEFERIAMPACAFGCDALFELGYIGVSDGGRIEVSPRIDEHPDLKSRVDMMFPVPHRRRMESPPRTQLRVAPAGDLPRGLTVHGETRSRLTPA